VQRNDEIICIKTVVSDQWSVVSGQGSRAEGIAPALRDGGADGWYANPGFHSPPHGRKPVRGDPGPELFSRSPSGRHLATDHALPERFHAASVDGRIYESSRVTSEARPASYLQKTGGFYIAAGAHRFSQRSFLAEDGRSRFVVSHPSQNT